jgi:hypothetical protein
MQSESALVRKWADYIVSAARYDSTRAHLERVRVQRHQGATIDPSVTELTRSELLDLLIARTTFVTATERPEDRAWVKGQWVGIVTIRRQPYIRTDRIRSRSDYLGRLAEF